MKISDSYCVKLLTMIYRKCNGNELLFNGSADEKRRRWDFLLKSFGVDPSLRLTLGGLRGGSAVWAYRRGVPIPQIQWNLRLRHQEETASSSLSPSSRTSCVSSLFLIGFIFLPAARGMSLHPNSMSLLCSLDSVSWLPTCHLGPCSMSGSSTTLLTLPAWMCHHLCFEMDVLLC